MKHAALFLGLAGALLAGAPDGNKEKLEIVTTQTAPFASGGEIRIMDSFGEVHVEAWDRNEVEITVRKATRKRYTAGDHDKALRFLNAVEVVAAAENPKNLVITTRLPNRNWLTRPFRGMSNLELEYHLKVPREVNLSVAHDIGEVKIEGVLGNIRATADIGQVSIKVPEGVEYGIDARARLGEVNSELPGYSKRAMLSDRFVTGAAAPAYTIFARVGIGEVDIHPLRASDQHPQFKGKELFAALPLIW